MAPLETASAVHALPWRVCFPTIQAVSVFVQEVVQELHGHVLRLQRSEATHAMHADFSRLFAVASGVWKVGHGVMHDTLSCCTTHLSLCCVCYSANAFCDAMGVPVAESESHCYDGSRTLCTFLVFVVAARWEVYTARVLSVFGRWLVSHGAAPSHQAAPEPVPSISWMKWARRLRCVVVHVLLCVDPCTCSLLVVMDIH